LGLNPYLIAATVAAAGGLLALGVTLWGRRNNPAERERRRRALVNARGRVTDGVVTDVDVPAAGEGKGLIHYTYRIGGVEYSAAQDISDLAGAIESDPSKIVGAVNVKYQTRNPFNSIVICEEWSGLRRRAAVSQKRAQ
jgi:hypothetical protein